MIARRSHFMETLVRLSLFAIAVTLWIPTLKAQAPVMPASQVFALPGSPARSLVPGETKRSALLSSDAMLADSSHFGRWQFEGKRGQRVTITQRSEAFDTFLLLGRQGVAEALAENDDSEGTNSEIDFTLPDDALYVVIAASFAPKETGEYTLTLTIREPLPGMTGPVTPVSVLLREPDPMQRVGLDRRMGSQLDARDAKMDDSTHYELWYFSANAGDAISVTLESSEFSGALFVGAQGSHQTEAGAVGSRPRVDFTAQASGTFVIVVKGNSAADRGSYIIDLARKPRAP